jgi:hypothetical protein
MLPLWGDSSPGRRARVARILEVCPEDLRESAKSVLEPANGKSFKTRIEELIASAGEIGSHGPAPEPAWFAGEAPGTPTPCRKRMAR